MYVNNNLGLNDIKSYNSAENTKDGSNLGKDDFVKLLMQQMKSQDPLEPTSNTESIAQMANFSSLEQTTNLNKSFQDLSRVLVMNSLANSAQVIGKYATIQDGSQEISGKIIGTSLKDGEVMVKVRVEEGKDLEYKLGSVISLSETEVAKKEYKVLPSNEV
ncbi:MAG: hypothetical protein JXM74_10225 [Fusobacteriaceae bacterium]|jgi:flagellar basal-body rod modification protein FlgD|nr:hypothetical protein [Fusobacteriaceae bacterium]MBN2839117.1 hypothetical protein [Fusobacteriaceae bacterium]